MLIARLTAQLRCYVPEPVDETWGRLRHLGARREQLITEVGQPDPADAGPARVRLAGRAGHRPAAVPVQDLGRGDDGDPGPRRRRPRPHPTPRRGPVRAGGATRDHPAGRAETVACGSLRNLFAALADPAGVTRAPARRAGAGAAAAGGLGTTRQRKLADTETRMTAVLDELELTELVTSITGLSAVGAAAILAETGDPTPVRHRPRPGQTRRPGAAGEAVRHLHRPHQAHRPRPTRAAAGRLAGGLGSPTRQPRLRRPLPAPDHPRAQQAHARPRPRP